MTAHRIDALGSGVAGLVARVEPGQLSRAGLMLTVTALDAAAVATDGVITAVLTDWRANRPIGPTHRLSIGSMRARLDGLAFSAGHAGRTVEYRAEFGRARAVAALEFGIAGRGRDGLRELVCEASAATGSTVLVASVLRDHIER
ncbi:UNVERIFIED_CONTAM: hypothetical protein DES50_102130 [Williamsia faeni]